MINTMNKKLYIKTGTLVTALVLALASCNELTDGYSTDPVNITDPSVISTFKYLSGAQTNLIGAYEGDVNRLVGMWTGHFSGEDRQYIGLGNYSVSGRDFNGEWAAIYSAVLKNTQIVKSKARVEKNHRVLGIAQVMDAMSLGLAADLWGDVPYSDALKYPIVTEPKFDAQASVYSNVQLILDSAINNLALPVPNVLVPTAADIFFGGDPGSWTAVAHTLKARYYLHARDYTNAAIHSAPGTGITAASGNMMATHGTAYLQTFNLFYSFITYDRAGYMGANSYAPRLLDATEAGNRNNAKTNEEARLNFFYFPGGGLNFASIAYEPNVLCDYDWGSGAGYDGFFGCESSFPMVTFEENMLIQAEALSKSNDFAGALTALNQLRAYYNTGGHVNPGYAADFGLNYAPYTAADFAPGGMENPNNLADNTALLTEILEERYITLTGQLEGFNDVRRTGNFLKLSVRPGNPSLPLRLLYPQSELNTNRNVPSVTLFEATPINTTTY